MKVKMLKTTQGSESGYVVNSYKEGEVYDMADKLGQHFVDVGVAQEVGDDTEPTKRVLEPSADNAQKMRLASDYNSPELLAQAEEDERRGIVRPELQRMREMANKTQTDVDVAEQKRKTQADAKKRDVRRQQEELEASLNEPSDELDEDGNPIKGKSTKALKSTDYENKGRKG